MITVRETDDRFYIAESRLPNGGLGVFAKRFIGRNEFLEVVGVMVHKNGVGASCTHYANDYKFAAIPVDATRDIIPLGYAAIINHAIKKEGMNMQMIYRRPSQLFAPFHKRNANSGALILMALRDIEAGEECLHYYGEKWDEVLQWKSQSLELAESVEKDWQEFLSYGLYNLDFFDKFKVNDPPKTDIVSSADDVRV